MHKTERIIKKLAYQLEDAMNEIINLDSLNDAISSNHGEIDNVGDFIKNTSWISNEVSKINLLEDKITAKDILNIYNYIQFLHKLDIITTNFHSAHHNYFIAMLIKAVGIDKANEILDELFSLENAMDIKLGDYSEHGDSNG